MRLRYLVVLRMEIRRHIEDIVKSRLFGDNCQQFLQIAESGWRSAEFDDCPDVASILNQEIGVLLRELALQRNRIDK